MHALLVIRWVDFQTGIRVFKLAISLVWDLKRWQRRCLTVGYWFFFLGAGLVKPLSFHQGYYRESVLFRGATLSMIHWCLFSDAEQALTRRRALNHRCTLAEHHTVLWLIVREFQIRLCFSELAVVFTDLVAVQLIFGSLNKVLDFLDGCLDTLESDPFECWFARIRHLCLDNQSNWLEDVSYVVEPSDLGF